MTMQQSDTPILQTHQYFILSHIGRGARRLACIRVYFNY